MVQMILSPAQMDAVKATGEHILIKGIPGSGKTTVLLAKLEKVLEEDSTASVLFITYNNTLQKYINESLVVTLDEDISKHNVEVTTYHRWAKKVLSAIFAYKNPMKYDTFDTFYQTSLNSESHRFYKESKYKDFLLEEIKWIKNKNINTYDEYKSIKRGGRGQALQEPDRKAVYDIMMAFNQYLTKKKVVMWEDYANMVNENIVQINEKNTYDYVFIDETQDLSQAQLISLRKVARKALIFAADLGQKIYKTHFTWRSAGINVKGGRTKSLIGAFRSTKEIMNLANSLLLHDTTLTEADIKQDYDAQPSDILPAVLVAQQKTEYDMVSDLIKEILESYAETNDSCTIGVLNFENYVCDTIKGVLSKKGIEVERIKDQLGSALRPGVKVLTMHGAKGLEFDEVIITGMSSKFPNLKYVLEEDMEEEINMARRLLYVSMTRAKNNVYITYKGEPSMYIKELDVSLYGLEKN